MYKEASLVRKTANHLFYSLRNWGDVINSARAVNEVVGNYIDGKGLKVRESDFLSIEKGGKHPVSKEYSFSLDTYLKSLEKLQGVGKIIINQIELFGLSHIVYAVSYERPSEEGTWQELRDQMTGVDKTFNTWEENAIIMIDRVRTHENIKKYFEELDAKIPDQSTTLYIFDTEHRRDTRWLGHLDLRVLREKSRDNYFKTRDEIIERLIDFDGDCLSLDAGNLVRQRIGLSNDASSLVSQYGDILLNPHWKERFFIYDP